MSTKLQDIRKTIIENIEFDHEESKDHSPRTSESIIKRPGIHESSQRIYHKEFSWISL